MQDVGAEGGDGREDQQWPADQRIAPQVQQAAARQVEQR
jgi:hypothetical protein